MGAREGPPRAIVGTWGGLDLLRSLVGAVRLVATYFKLNLASAMEYRVSFLSLAVGMALNDALMFFFWWIYFSHFPEVGGWGFRDVILLWAVVATGIGLAVVVCGNSNRIAMLISQGQLDYYLALPRNPLLHLLVSRMSPSGWGDFVFGLIAFGVGAWLGILSIGLAVVLTLVCAAIAVAYLVLVGSLAFFMGNAEAAALRARDSLITFSLYPGSIFEGWPKLVLLTVIPAGFMAHIPVELLRDFDAGMMALLLGFTAALWLAAICVFQIGLRRYESGNLIAMRG